MTYKEGMLNRVNDNVNEAMKDMPPFIKRFFASKPRMNSELSYATYWVAMRDFLTYLIEQKIIKANQLSEVSEDDIRMIKITNINQYINYLKKEKGMKPTSIKTRVAQLKSWFSYFEDDEIITTNIARRVEYNAKAPKEFKYSTLEDVDNIIKAIEDSNINEYDKLRNIAIVKLFIGSGIRLTELIGLDVQDVDLEENTIRVLRKGSETFEDYSIVNVAPSAMMAVENYLKVRHMRECEDDALFVSQRCNRVSKGSIENMFKRFSNGTASPHMLRKGNGNYLYNETGDLNLVANQLGHSSSQTTKRWYSEVSTDRAKKALENI